MESFLREKIAALPIKKVSLATVSPETIIIRMPIKTVCGKRSCPTVPHKRSIGISIKSLV
jgi:hypothetical protein